VIYVYRVDVEVVDAGAAILQWSGIGLIQVYMIDAMPLEEHLSGLDVELLEDTLPG
jgi:hypothetical protein